MSKRRFEQRFIAFIDILGFSDLVKEMTKHVDLFGSVRDALKHLDDQSRSFREYRQKRRNRTMANGTPVGDFQMAAFSDCCVFSDSYAAWRVIDAVQALGSRFLRDGILTRGAILKGKAYHNGGVLFGPGIIDAYKRETGVAIYPRIIVSDDLYEDLWGYHQEVWGEQLLQQDHDGLWFVNLLVPSLSSWTPLLDPTAPKDTRSHLEQVRWGLINAQKRAQGNPAHVARVTWLVHKYNRVAGDEGLRKLLYGPTG